MGMQEAGRRAVCAQNHYRETVFWEVCTQGSWLDWNMTDTPERYIQGLALNKKWSQVESLSHPAHRWGESMDIISR